MYFLFQNETGMSVDDKVAFALTFLSDSKLVDFITQITVKLIEEGNLAGMLLTGNLLQTLQKILHAFFNNKKISVKCIYFAGTNIEGVNLLQQYLDMSGDVQSVSLIAARSFQPELTREPQVQEWISRLGWF